MTFNSKCKDCGTPLGVINWTKLNLKKTDEVRCNDCVMKEMGF